MGSGHLQFAAEIFEILDVPRTAGGAVCVLWMAGDFRLWRAEERISSDYCRRGRRAGAPAEE